MDLFEDCRELERLAAYHKLRGELRGVSRAGIIFGLLNLAIATTPIPFGLLMGRGLVGPDFRLVNLGAVGGSLFVLGAGLWFAFRPSAAGLLVGGLTLLALGACDLWEAALPLRAGGHLALAPAVFGVLFLLLAVIYFVSYSRARELFNRNYPEEDLARADELLRHVTKTKLKDATDVITLAAGLKDWRVLLAPGAALFVEAVSKGVVAARKEEVTFEQTGPVMLGGTFPAKFRVREETWKGTIAPAGFAKYLAWKLEEPPAAPETKAAPEAPTDAIKASQHDFHP